MKKPSQIPLTDHPRTKEPSKIPLSYPEPITDDIWDRYETHNGPPVFAKKNENNLENNSESIRQLESD